MAVRFRQLFFERSFHTVEHPNALFISLSIRFVSRLGLISFKMGHEKMMDGLGCLSTASIDAFDLVANMSIIILFCQLGAGTIR
jgi:hypothetical protein